MHHFFFLIFRYLRKRNVIKAQVDASFNRDSSIESETCKRLKHTDLNELKSISPKHGKLVHQINTINESNKKVMSLESLNNSYFIGNISYPEPFNKLEKYIDNSGDDVLDRNSTLAYNIQSSYDSIGDSMLNEDDINFISTPHNRYKKRQILHFSPISNDVFTSNNLAMEQQQNSTQSIYTQSRINTPLIFNLDQISKNIFESRCSINLLNSSKSSIIKKKSSKKKKKSGKNIMFAEKKYKEFLKKREILEIKSTANFEKKMKKNEADQNINTNEPLKNMSDNVAIYNEAKQNCTTYLSSNNETHQNIKKNLSINNSNETSLTNYSKVAYIINNENCNTSKTLCIKKIIKPAPIIELLDTIDVINLHSSDTSTSSSKKNTIESKY